MAHRFVPEDDGFGSAALASFVVDHVQGSSVLAWSGEIDVSTVSALREAMQKAMRSSRRMIVDLSDVTFLDSTSVGVILGVVRANREHQDGALCLVGASGVVLRVLAITGLTKLVPVLDSVEEAIAKPA